MARTSTVKNIADEGWAYFMTMPTGESGLYARLQVTDDGYESDDGEFDDAITYSSGEAFVVCMNSLLADVTIAVGQDADDSDVTVTFSAGTPIGEAKKTSDLASIPSGYPKITSGGTHKDLFEILKVYDPTTYVGFVTTTGGNAVEAFRPIRDKGILKGRKRNVDTAGTVSMGQYFTNAGEGLAYQGEKRVVIKVEIREDALLETQEAAYYYGALSHRPETNESQGDSMSENTYEFDFERKFAIEL